jgi:hypothetical protein
MSNDLHIPSKNSVPPLAGGQAQEGDRPPDQGPERLTPTQGSPAPAGAGQPAVEGQEGPRGRPSPLGGLQPKRKIDLAKAILPDPGSERTVEILCVREVKGVAAYFTPNLGATLTFHGLVYKPQDEYETHYQIVSGRLQDEPRVMRYAKRIGFVPAYVWSSSDIALLPYKLTTFGRRVLHDLQELQPRFPDLKIFVEWDGTCKRHVVHYEDLTDQEKAVIAKIAWPSREQILDALSATAYDDLSELIEANEDIKALFRSREVQ